MRKKSPKSLAAIPSKGEKIHTSRHHPFDEPEKFKQEHVKKPKKMEKVRAHQAKKHSKEDLAKANAHMKKHGG